MNKLTYSLPAKIAAVFLITVMLLLTLLAGAMAFAGVAFSLQAGTADIARRQVTESYLYRYGQQVAQDFYLGQDLASRYSQANYMIVVRDTADQVLWSNYDAAVPVLTSFTVRQSVDRHPVTNNTPQGSETTWVAQAEYNITLYAKADMNRQDAMGYLVSLVDTSMRNQAVFIVLAVLGILLFLVLLVFLFCSAGRRKGSEGIVLNRADRIPFDLFTVFFLALAGVQGAALSRIYYAGEFGSVIAILLLAVLAIADFLLLLWYMLSIAARVKAGTLLRNTVVFWVLRLAWRVLCAIGRGIRQIPWVWKVLLVIGVVFFANLLAALAERAPASLLLGLLEALVLGPLVFLVAVNQRKLKLGAERIASGDLNSPIDTSRMLWDFKRFGDSLNSIQGGLSRAVEARMKSERFKTELITNVSHDIKTPLTSIINYVGLIKQQELPSQTVQDYVAVLDRQSARLKKLTDDLVEASKASTGNLAVKLEPADIGVLLAQTAGEYAERLDEQSLELVLSQPDEAVRVLADGRHLWRVFDNLMSNICKYAQPATRVYVNLETDAGQVRIVFRNISRSPLNISSEELMERFVRGDSARSTEGSGLGLSIARSLVELQQGRMQIHIDGDLFKTVLTFAQLRA
ncbi:MAG: sensor histidine kinase [Clostridiaceae bacterium]|jgi:signal transduction histidine kinase|nr:sensor histidine kinase [Clostridiaceae bacterium]